MKITIQKSTRARKERGIHINDQSVLFSPFHVWNPDKETDKAFQAYKVYLYQVIDKGLDPTAIARTLAQKHGLKISLRWKPGTGEDIKREVQNLAQIAQTTSGLSLISNRDLSTEKGLKDYLEWKLSDVKPLACRDNQKADQSPNLNRIIWRTLPLR